MIWIVFFSLVAAASSALAADADEKTGPAASSPAGRYEALVNEYQGVQREFSKAYNAAKDDEERRKLKYPQPQAYSRRFLDLARQNPKDAVATDALLWVVTNDRYGEDFNTAVEILLEEHIESDKLELLAQTVVYSGAQDPEKTLTSILEKSPHRAVKGWATYSLGLVARSKDNGTKAERLLEEVIEKFGDVESHRGTLADSARGDLFEMRNLAIGKVAPEIEGEDVEGKSFKLSDYRGKVVVIDFWGDW